MGGHIVAIRNGEQVTVPTLEDALNMVNNPYNDNTIQYHGPAELYTNSDNYSLNGMDYNYGTDPFEDHIKLREDALQNGAPKFAFMSSQYTDGALPQTMGRNSPSGSLTSLDSLDEVPSDQLAVQQKPPSVTGIIVKDKVKSAARRRVTFSDSIEFNDGLTGNLETAEKESCKQYIKQFNSRLAANNNTTYSASNSKPTIPIVKGPHVPGKVIGTPGNTPIKTGEIPCSIPSSSSGSMVVPMSVYSQLNKPVASAGESTSSTTTYTDRPQHCVAEVDTKTHSVSNDKQSKDVVDVMTDDSLEMLQDSLDGDNSDGDNDQEYRTHHYETMKDNSSDIQQEVAANKTMVEQTDISNGNHGDVDKHYGDHHDNIYHSNQHNFDYYGNPTTIYHNPFGPRSTPKDVSQNFTVAKETDPNYGYAPELLLQPAVQYTAGSDNGGQVQNTAVSQSDVTNGNSQSDPKTTDYSPVYTSSSNSPYYRSWYQGSFFSSKAMFVIDGDTDKQDKQVKKIKSVAYNLMDDNQNPKQYPNEQKEKPKTRTSASRTSSRNSENSGRVNPLGSPKGEISKTDEQIDSQVKHKTSSPSVSKQDSRTTRMTAKPPHPSTRHKGVVYSSPLHRKRAVASAAKRAAGKHSPRSTTPRRRSPVSKTKETAARTKDKVGKVKEKNTKNEQSVNRGGSASTTANTWKEVTRGHSSSSSDDDELIQHIQRDMDRISMLNNPSPTQEEHQKIINTINLADSPSPRTTKSDFRSVYKKVHKPRIGSAKQRAQLVTPNRAQPSKIPVYSGPSGNNNYSPVSNFDSNGGVSSTVNQRWTGAMDETSWTDRQNSRQGTHSRTDKELVHPQTTALKQSIALDKTPTDDEINVLWDRVRTCLNHKDTQSVGSDSCVNRVDVRRSRIQEPLYINQQYNTLRDSSLSRNSRAASIAGLGSMRRYGSHEILRRYGSADNISYRQQPLLQQRAQRSRQSGQGKPPAVPRQQFSPMASRQAPIVTMSSRGKYADICYL